MRYAWIAKHKAHWPITLTCEVLGVSPTYIATDEGWLYLTGVINLFSRQVVGWSMRDNMQANALTDALRMAWFRRRPEPGLIFHSDRGSPVLQP